MIQEIEQIKAAEQDAIIRIEAANKQADLLILKAREEATTLFATRSEEAELEVRTIRENLLAHTHTESTLIREKADREVEELVVEGELRIPAAVDLIVKRVVGGADVLSGTNG
ncbi:MAG: hypothetical protein V1862_07595 [Methanobacteriota archaeon]